MSQIDKIKNIRGHFSRLHSFDTKCYLELFAREALALKLLVIFSYRMSSATGMFSLQRLLVRLESQISV